MELGNFALQGIGSSKNMPKRRPIHIRKGKKVRSHLQPLIAFQIHYKCANFLFSYLWVL
jgi:hypothetical protein